MATYERIMKALEEQRKLILKSPEYGKQLFEDLGIADFLVTKQPSKKKVKKKR